MKFKLLCIMLLVVPCFASQGPDIDTSLEWRSFIASTHWPSMSQAKTYDKVLQALSDEQFVQLLEQHPLGVVSGDDNIQNEDINAYIQRLKEFARRQKLVSDEIDCSQLYAEYGIRELTEKLQAQHARFPRELGESTYSWKARVKFTIETEERIQLQAEEMEALRVQQLKGYAWTGAKIGGLTVVAAALGYGLHSWYKKKQAAKQKEKQTQAETFKDQKS